MSVYEGEREIERDRDSRWSRNVKWKYSRCECPRTYHQFFLFVTIRTQSHTKWLGRLLLYVEYTCWRYISALAVSGKLGACCAPPHIATASLCMGLWMSRRKGNVEVDDSFYWIFWGCVKWAEDSSWYLAAICSARSNRISLKQIA